MQGDFDAFDLPPTTTATSFLYDLADETIRGKIKRLTAENLAETSKTLRTTVEARYQDLLTLFHMRSLIQSIVIGKYNDSPFYITHPDLHNRNIIIEGEAIPEQSKPPNESSRLRFLEPGVYESKSVPPIEGYLELTGLVDWDAAHPLPLQLAAIYPKFLETLPGAEFPDLPSNYMPPDFNREKELFLSLLSRKEQFKTGCTIVSDLIRNGSWERDFFTVALKRGDVRAKWREWYHKDKFPDCAQARPCTAEDAVNMQREVTAYLQKHKNFAAAGEVGGHMLVWRVMIDLLQIEAEVVDSAWIEYASF